MSSIHNYISNLAKQKIVHINSLNSFVKLSNELINCKTYIFRGICHQEQKYPKIIRNNIVFSSNTEYLLLKDFEKYYGLYYKARDCWEFMAIAQHHGLATRLIDFTTNPFVAAFFCLHECAETEEEYAIYCADRNAYENANNIGYSLKVGSTTFHHSVGAEDEFADIFLYRTRIMLQKNLPVLMDPNYSNNRIFFQQGLFLIPANISRNEINKLYDNMPIKIVISEKIRERVLSYLAANGYDEFRLMPDLSSACFEINKMHL